MIHISKHAQKYFLKLLSNQEPNTYIRIHVDNPGTYYAKFKISYATTHNIKHSDIKQQLHYISIYIDKISIPYLENSEIDLVNKPLGAQLLIKTPNINLKIKDINKTNTKNTPLDERIKYVLTNQINPQLKNHGGEVKLINITEDYIVILQFSGGCNGCAMASYTLKYGIEKTLTNLFPEIQGIQDVTEHQHGTHSFY